MQLAKPISEMRGFPTKTEADGVDASTKSPEEAWKSEFNGLIDRYVE